MNLLIVGSGQGSWAMRGEQLGAALGARLTAYPRPSDWAWADLAVLVKRAGVGWARIAHAAGVPIVWDALDFWRQPVDNILSESDAVALLQRTIATIRPALVIGATEAMASVAGGVCLPHHGRIGLTPTPARERVSVVGYDGSPNYLAAWRPALERCCAARGWSFVVNPPDLSAVDILVAFRGGPWDGWICREWKSGVKAVNAILAGRPLITQMSAAWRELQPCGSTADTEDDLERALEVWANHDRRAAVVEQSRRRASAFTVEAMAARYRDLLAAVPLGATC